MEASSASRTEELRQLCASHRVRRLHLFGSAATGAFDPDTSDLDFAVEFADAEVSGAADRYFGMIEGLEALFGRRVDLVDTSAIRNPAFREELERTRVLLYAA